MLVLIYPNSRVLPTRPLVRFLDKLLAFLVMARQSFPQLFNQTNSVFASKDEGFQSLPLPCGARALLLEEGAIDARGDLQVLTVSKLAIDD